MPPETAFLPVKRAFLPDEQFFFLPFVDFFQFQGLILAEILQK